MINRRRSRESGDSSGSSSSSSNSPGRISSLLPTTTTSAVPAMGSLNNRRGKLSSSASPIPALLLSRRKEIIGGLALLLILLLVFSPHAFAVGALSSSNKSGLPKQLIRRTNLDAVNEKLKTMSLDEVLTWAHSVSTTKQHNMVDVTSFGPSGMVILHKLHQLGLRNVPIVTVDTLHLFPETIDFAKSLMDGSTLFKRDLKLSVYKPKNKDREDFDNEYGADIFKTDPEKYAYLSKVEPLSRALQEHNAKIWITGRRQSQGGERKNLQILEADYDAKSILRFKLNPLAYWTYDDVWKYIRVNKVPYNPLHDQGYKSVGDTMTTIKVDASADERSGRFVGLGQTECGIHSTRAKIQKMMEQANQQQQQQQQSDSFHKIKLHTTEPLPCSGCLELDPQSLDDIVETGRTDLLIEFHSPLCGHCRDFAPKFEKVAIEILEKHHTDIQVGRFDITYTDVPKKSQELGLSVEATPALFLIKRLPEFQLIEFKGRHTSGAVLAWLKQNTEYM